MDFVAYFAIPMNVIILIVCRFPSVMVGARQDTDNLMPNEEPAVVKFLMS